MGVVSPLCGGCQVSNGNHPKLSDCLSNESTRPVPRTRRVVCRRETDRRTTSPGCENSWVTQGGIDPDKGSSPKRDVLGASDGVRVVGGVEVVGVGTEVVRLVATGPASPGVGVGEEGLVPFRGPTPSETLSGPERARLR